MDEKQPVDLYARLRELTSKPLTEEQKALRDAMLKDEKMLKATLRAMEDVEAGRYERYSPKGIDGN
jgi:hypothetical protein